jgi:hypothetical protein
MSNPSGEPAQKSKAWIFVVVAFALLVMIGIATT